MKVFKTINGGTITVGRNSRENEVITFQIAKANDLWFHVQDIPGPHVILNSPCDIHHEDAIKYAVTLCSVKGNYVHYCKAIDVSKEKYSKCGEVSIENFETMKIN